MGNGTRTHFTWTYVAALLWSTSARAEQEKDWFSSEEGDEEQPDPEVSDEEDAPQEGGSVEVGGRTGNYLTPGTTSLVGGVLLGVGGSGHAESEGLDSEGDLAASYGLQLGADYIIHEYFAVGGELRLIGMNSQAHDERDLGRDIFIDLVTKPRGRYVFESIGLELYATLPFGLSFPNLDDEKGGDAGLGYTLGLGFGASYFFGEHFGLGSDLTWLWHFYSSEFTNPINGAEQEESVRLGQLSLFVNAIYAL